MKNLTAIEWLIEELQKGRATFFKLNDKEERIITLAGKDIIEQAKQMEKEQMRLIYEGLLQNVGIVIRQSDLPTFEQYYNETYGTNES